MTANIKNNSPHTGPLKVIYKHLDLLTCEIVYMFTGSYIYSWDEGCFTSTYIDSTSYSDGSS